MKIFPALNFVKPGTVYNHMDWNIGVPLLFEVEFVSKTTIFSFEKVRIICSNLFLTVHWIHFDYFNNKENRFARTADQSAFRKGIKTLAVLTVLSSRYNSRKLGQAMTASLP